MHTVEVTVTLADLGFWFQLVGTVILFISWFFFGVSLYSIYERVNVYGDRKQYRKVTGYIERQRRVRNGEKRWVYRDMIDYKVHGESYAITDYIEAPKREFFVDGKPVTYKVRLLYSVEEPSYAIHNEYRKNMIRYFITAVVLTALGILLLWYGGVV